MAVDDPTEEDLEEIGNIKSSDDNEENKNITIKHWDRFLSQTKDKFQIFARGIKLPRNIYKKQVKPVLTPNTNKEDIFPKTNRTQNAV